MTNAEKFLEELKKKKKNGIKVQMLEDKIAQDNGVVRDDMVGGDTFTSAFLAALDTERSKNRATVQTEEDIAPIRSSVKTSSGNTHGGKGGKITPEEDEEDNLLDFFDKGAFRDGYQVGDVSKTILGTVGDIGVGAVKGVMKMGEGIGDAATYGAAALADKLGYDENAEKWRKNAQRTAIDDALAPVDKYLGRYSVLGRTLDSTAEALGQIGAIIATGGIAAGAGAGAVGTTAATSAVMGVSSFGTSTGEAYKDGAETGEAETYGLIAAAADTITEMLSGGLGKGVKAVGLSHGLGGFDDIVAKKVSEKITNTIAKNAVEYGVKASGEGLEEVLAGTVQAIAKYKTYAEEQGEDFGQIIEDENLLEQFIVGAMASGVSQVPDVVDANKSGTDFITGRTKNEQAVIDRVVEQRVKEAETDAGGVKLTAKQRQDIEEQAASDMERGRIDIDTIEEALGGEDFETYQTVVKNEDAQRKEYEELGKLKEPTLAERTRYEELHQKRDELYSDERRTKLKTQLSQRVEQMAAQDRLSESYREHARRSEYFTDDTSKYKADAAKKTVQNLVDSKIANNTGRTREFAETVAKIAEDKGIVFNFTNNAKIKESGKADTVPEGVTVNGFKDADGITVNLDSPAAWDFVVGHEVAHTLEGTAEYTELAQAVKVYTQTKGDYDSRRAAIASIYAEGTDIDSELTADVVGELFADEGFVAELSTKHQNVFQRVFAEIKHLYKMVTAGTKEARRLEVVKRNFEKAYRAQQAKVQTVDSVAQNTISADTEGRSLSDAQKEYFKETKVTDDDGKLKVMYHGTRKGGFTVFDPSFSDDGLSLFFTDSPAVAESYSRTDRVYEAHRGEADDVDNEQANYKVYLNIKNPFVVDAGGRTWDRVIEQETQDRIEQYKSLTAEERAEIYDYVEIVKEDGGDLEEVKKELYRAFDHALEMEKIGIEEPLAGVFEKLLDDNYILDYEILAKIAWENFSDAGIENHAKSYYNSRQVAKRAKEAGHDGVIIKNIIDMGRYGAEYTASMVSIAFDAEQVKSVANAEPTSDPDIRRSLSDAIAPVGGRGVALRDLRYQGAEMQEAAPVQQTEDQTADVGKKVAEVPEEQTAPLPGMHSELDRLNAEYDAARTEYDQLTARVQDMYAELTPEEQEQAMEAVLAAGERLNAAQDALNAEQQTALSSYSDADIPPEMDAPYYGEETTAADEFADRDMKSVGNRSVKAYQYDNPEVKPFYQRVANEMLGDLSRTQRGERYMNADGEWTGAGRITAYDIAALKDEYGVSYAEIDKALRAIIEDHGAENYALAKRVEILIHDRLSKGFVDVFSGLEIPPDQDYLNLMEQKQSETSGDEAFAALMADADTYAPPTAEDIAPVAETAAADPLAGVSSAVETEVEEIDAPVTEADIDAAVGEIQTTYDKILQKKQNAEAELANNREKRTESEQRIQTRIDELQRKYDGKKRKDTKAANNLLRQIDRLKRLKSDIDADYAKRISDIEKRIARRDFDLQQDHPKADKLERAYAKIDAQLEQDRAAVEAEFAQRREELTAATADKNDFIRTRAMELYRELSGLKKGVRASYELGYLLDRGYDWRTLKSTLLKVNRNPDYVINPDSVEETDIRAMLTSEYSSKAFEIGELDGEMQDRLAELEADAEAQKAEVRKGEEKLRRKQVEDRYMNDLKVRFAQSGFDLDELLRMANDISGFKTVDKTPQRVNYAVLGDEAGEIMNDLTVNRVAQSNTEGIRWLNRYLDPKTGEVARISRQYHIKPGSKESAAAQMYAEGFYVDEYDKIYKYGDRELAADFPDAKVQDTIKGLARDGRIRAIYDETLDAMNEVRVRNGYPEIPKRQNYFLHFREMGDFFSTMGTPFNPDAMNKKDLPTDINGMTVDNRPGKPYFASEHQRKGKRTSFDLLGGLEQYLTSAKDQIYQIDNIQAMRALRNYIADDYGRAKGLDSLAGLTEEEVQQRIDDVFDNHLSTYAKFLNEEANILAGKTALIDRALEGVIGRRGMTFMTELNKQVGANQVGFNISSSLTNFIAPVQAFAKMNKAAFVKGFAQTVSNRVGGIFGRGDNFAAESPVMVRREGAKRFKTNWWQRRQDNAYALMGAVDSLSTEIIARAKFNELTAKGMDTAQAHYETDKWVSALMGDRSLGQMPHLFNSKTFGMILKYQLEVRNQLDSMFADTIREAKLSTAQIEDVKKRNAVKAAKIASTFATLAVGQHIFGQVFESIAGYNPAFDIIEAIIKAAGWDDDEDDDDTVLDNLEQGILSIAEDMPYYSILSGGRIPLESALPIETLIKGKDSYGNDVSRWKTALEAAPYYVLPGGYGQIKKTVGGLGMYSDEHPVAGSYTDSGNLRFPVGEELLDVAQAAFFGQYSSANARDYFDDERKPLTAKQIDEYAKADMTIQDYWRYRDGLKEHDKLADQAEYINSLDIPTWKKNLFINNLTDRKEAIDMADYGQYGSLAEMDFAKKSPEKYKLLQEQGVTYEQYQSFDDDTKNAYEWAAKSPEKYGFIRVIGYTLDDYAHATDTEKDAFTWAYNNPEKYMVSRAVSDDLFVYRGYTAALNDIKADKDAEGKSISGSRKDKVVDWLNGIDADYGQKIILLKSEYPSDDSYNYDIIDYLNERDDITAEEMTVILTELGFKVLSDGTITWD